MARYQWATVLSGKAEFVQAREIALAGRTAFPSTTYGQLCDNVITAIESKSSQITTERVWAEPLPHITVRYANVTRIYFRVVKVDYVARLNANQSRDEWLTEPEKQSPIHEPPTLAFDHVLPATSDYKPREEFIPAPKGLPPGFYYVIASHEMDFGSTNNVVSFTGVWVSDLAVVNRNDGPAGTFHGVVLSATTGQPVEGARVQVWGQELTGALDWRPHETALTDKDGFYTAPVVHFRNNRVVVSHGNQQLAVVHSQQWHANDPGLLPHERTVFLTDRSLYRPGQTVQFKGICIRFNHDSDNYNTIANHDVTVVFADPNGKEVGRARVRTNNYGSFSGSFTAPRDRITGRMNLHLTQGDPPGMQQLSVEEYKRPRFQVKVEAPKEAFKLNDAVTVAGKAIAYTALRATVSADQWLVEGGEAKFTITTTTLDGEGQAAKGTLRIHKLKQPDAVACPELDGGYRYRPIAANEEPKRHDSLDGDDHNVAGLIECQGRSCDNALPSCDHLSDRDTRDGTRRGLTPTLPKHQGTSPSPPKVPETVAASRTRPRGANHKLAPITGPVRE